MMSTLMAHLQNTRYTADLSNYTALILVAIQSPGWHFNSHYYPTGDVHILPASRLPRAGFLKVVAKCATARLPYPPLSSKTGAKKGKLSRSMRHKIY